MLHASTRIALHGTNRAKPCGRGFTGYAYVRNIIFAKRNISLDAEIFTFRKNMNE